MSKRNISPSTSRPTTTSHPSASFISRPTSSHIATAPSTFRPSTSYTSRPATSHTAPSTSRTISSPSTINSSSPEKVRVKQPFPTCFPRECKRLGLPTLEHSGQFLKLIKNGENAVVVRCDRVQAREWDPFANAIACDNSIAKIVLYCAFQSDNDENDNKKGRVPAIQEVGVALRVCKGIGGCLASPSALVHLEFEKIFITPENLKFISKGLSRNNSLRELIFTDCKIGDDGITALFNGMCNNSTIATIQFSGCNLTDKSAFKIGKIIQHHAMRRHTDQWTTSLRGGNGGPPAFSSVAGSSSSGEGEVTLGITRMNLAHNRIGDKGAAALADALKFDVWITEVNLSSNMIGAEGARALKNVLVENVTLTALILRDNKISDKVINEINGGTEMNADQKAQGLHTSNISSEKDKFHPKHSKNLKDSHLAYQQVDHDNKNSRLGHHKQNGHPNSRAPTMDSELKDILLELRQELHQERELRSKLETELHMLANENRSLRQSTFSSSSHSSPSRHVIASPLPLFNQLPPSRPVPPSYPLGTQQPLENVEYSGFRDATESSPRHHSSFSSYQQHHYHHHHSSPLPPSATTAASNHYKHRPQLTLDDLVKAGRRTETTEEHAQATVQHPTDLAELAEHAQAMEAIITATGMGKRGSTLQQASIPISSMMGMAQEAGDEDDLLEMLESSFKKFSCIIDNLEKDYSLPTKRSQAPQ